jgi:hypothetical protein
MREVRVADTSGATTWLSLAATPIFALMALLAAADTSGPADILCSAAHGASPFSGMVPMYVLMSAFHSTPWVKAARRVTRERSG